MIPAIVGLSGPMLTPEERALFLALPPRGVILFARNIVDPVQLSDLVADIREILPPESVLMVDQEGGRVARLRPPHWPALPAAGSLASAEAAHAQGRAIGAMVKQAGFDVAAAPVLDLRLPGASDIIGDRAFSSDPEIVAWLGAAMARGIAAEGVIPVLKHMPGHGRALVDSHVALPVVKRGAALEQDFYPFARTRNLGWGMTAHVVYEDFDPDAPATLSRKVILDVIRTKIGFTGTLLSDDLAMGALSGPPAARARAARAAGCDIALFCSGVLAETRSVLEALAP